MAERRGGAELAERLGGRRDEIVEATLTRAFAVSEPPARGAPEYAQGLHAAVGVAVDYGLLGIERGDEDLAPPPEPLLSQARLAARSGVGLGTVLRRYFAGHVLIEDFLVQEAERDRRIDPGDLKRLLQSQATIVDRLLAAVSEAYAQEAERRAQGAERRRARLVERLLGGELVDASQLNYELEGVHIGLVASGQGGGEAVKALAAALDARPLVVSRGEEDDVTWAWLGFRQTPDIERCVRLASREPPSGLTLAIGEPGEGLAGWRLTHRQARAALPVAQRGGGPAVRYADVALLAAALQDDLLATSLRRLYLEPLEAGRDGGDGLRKTLCAYFAAERNLTAAAAALGVNRSTVSYRLQLAEARLGRPLSSCMAELEVALG